MKTAFEVADSRLLGSRNKEEINLLVPRKKTQAETDNQADYLVNKFNAPGYREAFCKVAWRLDIGTIQQYVGHAEGKNNPRAYFMTCARNEMRRRGVL